MDVRLRLSVWLSTAVFLVFLAALGVQIGGAFAHRADHGLALEAVLDWVPSAIYLYAIWACRSAARRVQRGARFGE